MDREQVDALVALTPENVFYLSEMPAGFTPVNRLLYAVRNLSPSICVLPRRSDAKLILTSAALELARKNTWITDLRPYATGTYIVRPTPVTELGKNAFEVFEKTIKEVGGIKKIAVERQNAPYSFVEKLTKSLNGTTIVDASPILEELRMIKTPEEARRFKEANRILCKAIKGLIKEIKPGITELELHNSLKRRILKEGGDSWQQTKIGRGPDNAPDIYNQPSKSKIKKGDIILLDVGCVYQGYTADLSRTIAVGKVSPEAIKIHEVLKSAQDILLEKLKIGTKVSELHSAVVKYVRDTLDKSYRRGNVGHGVGVELYDRPVISEDDHTPLAPGMTISAEVPYHKFGVGGFNIEDSVLVTDKGCEIVSDLPRKLIQV